MSVAARYPSQVVVGAACLGVVSALVVRRDATPVALLGGAFAVLACVATGRRLLWAVAAAALLGAWWGGARLEALDRSVLRPHLGETAPAVVVVTGPARRTQFSVRVPARVEQFDRSAVRERILLELPSGRAPPQGGRIELVLELRAPRPPEEGFSERDWLERQGVHVVGVGGRWRLVGRRGGVAGAADRLRASLAGSIAPGLSGERAGVVAGIVLGEDQGLSDELGDAFRASGLYHLLAVSGRMSRSSSSSRSVSQRPRASLDGSATSSRSSGSWATSPRSAGSRRSYGPVSRRPSSRSPGCWRGRATAGTSCSSARRCCWRGTRARCSSRGSSCRSRR